MSERIRSFIAIELTDERLLGRLAELQQILLNTGADLKLVERENTHFTLRFLGELPPTTIQAVTAEMENLTFKPFSIHLYGVGAFPNPHHINVVWIGVREGAEEAKMLFNQIEPRLRRLGLPPDHKGFSPHLTIGRVKTGRNRERLAEAVARLADYEVGTMRIGLLKLKKSVLTPKGPIYSTLYQIAPREQND